MASNYWLKLYHEMLDDPKVMTLRPALRWRFIETLLVAGEMGEDGLLPATDHYAWRVRANPEVVETELAELAEAGLLSRTEGQWVVTKFAERQSPDSAAERMRRMRERKRKQEYYHPETDEKQNGDAPVTQPVTIRNTDKIREDKDTDNNRAGVVGYPEVVTAYENEIGSLSPLVAEQLGDAVDEYGGQWVVDAIAIAVKNNKRKLSYVIGILENWHRDGRHSSKARNGPGANGDWAIVEQAMREGGELLKQHEEVLATVRNMGGWPRFKNAREKEWPWLRKEFEDKHNRVQR